MIFKILRILLCKIGIHSVEEYQDKFRSGTFYCTHCKKEMDLPY